MVLLVLVAAAAVGALLGGEGLRCQVGVVRAVKAMLAASAKAQATSTLVVVAVLMLSAATVALTVALVALECRRASQAHWSPTAAVVAVLRTPTLAVVAALVVVVLVPHSALLRRRRLALMVSVAAAAATTRARPSRVLTAATAS